MRPTTNAEYRGSIQAAWLWEGSHGDHHPPEHYGSAVFVALGCIVFILSPRDRRAQ